MSRPYRTAIALAAALPLLFAGVGVAAGAEPATTTPVASPSATSAVMQPASAPAPVPAAVASDEVSATPTESAVPYDPAKDTTKPVLVRHFTSYTSTGLLSFTVTDDDPNVKLRLSIDNQETWMEFSPDDNGLVEYQLPFQGGYRLGFKAFDSGHYTNTGSASSMFVTYDAIRPYMQYVSTTGSVAHLMATDRLLPDTPAGNRPTYPYQVWTQTACGVATPAADDDAACEWVKLTSPYLPTTVFDTGAYKYEDGPWDVDFAALDGQPSIVRVGDALENFSFTLAATTTGVAGVNLSSADLSTLNPGEGSVFTLADGSALPAGLSLDATTGVISGAPSESADGAIVAVQVTQSDGWTTIAGLSRFVVAAPTEVTPVPPTQVVDTVTIPTVTGVDYQIDGETVTGVVTVPDGETVHVTTKPQDGYKFTDDNVYEWDFSYVVPVVEPSGAPSTDQPAVATSEPAAESAEATGAEVGTGGSATNGLLPGLAVIAMGAGALIARRRH